MNNQDFMFKDWLIEKQLGAGAQSIILLASRQKLNGDIQKAAIRLIQNNPDKTDEHRRMEAEQFAHEYEILSRLNSAYIAPVLDFGLEPVPWIATELVPGMDMKKFLASNGKVDVEVWTRYAIHLLSGLSHAHSKKIIHQDVKPANILVTGDSAVWIDFSSATMIGKENIGYQGKASTPAYSSPERLLSQGFTTASDIFSLGIVLFELATGVHPWDFSKLRVDPRQSGIAIARIMSEKPLNYKGLNSAQKAVLQRMLVIDPRKRLDASGLLEILGAGHIGGATGLNRNATVLEQPQLAERKAPSKAKRLVSEPAVPTPVSPKTKPALKKAPPAPGASFFQKYRTKWWFWLAAIYLIGLAPLFGYGYFLYREASPKTKPVREKIRTFSSWATVIFPVFAYTSWPLAFIWGKKTGKKSFFILGAIQVISAIGMGIIQAITPSVIDSTGRATITLPGIFGIPLLLGVIAAIIATVMRPRYEEVKA